MGMVLTEYLFLDLELRDSTTKVGCRYPERERFVKWKLFRVLKCVLVPVQVWRLELSKCAPFNLATVFLFTLWFSEGLGKDVRLVLKEASCMSIHNCFPITSKPFLSVNYFCIHLLWVVLHPGLLDWLALSCLLSAQSHTKYPFGS